MRPSHLLVTLLCWLPLGAALAAAPDWSALASDPTWRRLLHVRPGETRSEVRSPDFFLATQSPGEPEAELHALRAAYDAPWTGDPEQHARCRFPARYRFLAQHVLLPGYTAREPRCAALERWARFDELRSASVILVSGYFGNPASTFGHALLRLNTSEPDSSRALLDLGFNFGALIPPGESTPAYVYRGLTGGYVAGFSDKYFFSHDQVYARNELRDMWDYELVLDSDQLMLLAMHLYELAGRKFTYYFLSDNCAFRLGELVELVTQQPVTQDSRVWFTPVELFHRLNAAHVRMPGGLVRQVRFVPSAESQLRSAMLALSTEESELARVVINGEATAPSLGALPPQRQAAVVDVLLSHAQLREVAEQPDVSLDTRRRTQSLLRSRLALPPAQAPLPTPRVRPSPADAAAPLSLGLGLAAEADGEVHALLRGAAFDYAALGDQGLDGGELVVLDTRLALLRRGGVRLDQLDAIRVRKLDTSGGELHRGMAWSWHTFLGMRRFGHLGGPRLRASAAFAAGTSRAWTSQLSTYAMLEAAALADPGTLALQPQIGLLTGPGVWRGSVSWAWRRETGIERSRGVASAALHARFGNLELRAEAARDPDTRWSLTLNRFR
jgi:Domain of unknown function (DUF4105)